MNKSKTALSFFWVLSLFLLVGCTPIGDKSTSMTIIYAATTFCALLLLLGYFFTIRKKDNWFCVLFASVLVVNIGYLMLATAKTLDAALWANRVAYLGSVFLPISMFKSIQKISNLKYPKWLNFVLTLISAFVFFVAASPGWLDIYYKSVALENIDGVSVLVKEYGPWHNLYLFYLVGCFVAMIATAIYATAKKKINSTAHAIIVIVAVFVNICVWLIEQLVAFDFEFLSVSYIITEIFLLNIYLVIQTQEKIIEALKAQNSSQPAPRCTELTKESQDFVEHCSFIIEQLPTLTTKEKEIYERFALGMSTKEVLVELNIKENTLKYHCKNIYQKLGVTSRKQLVEYVKAIDLANTTE